MGTSEMEESISLAESMNVDKLLKQLECPVCYQYCTPPCFQCRNGHLLCNCCLENVRNCPLCRAPHGENRALAMEQMIDMFQFPCAYKSRGCKAVMKLTEKMDHDETCPYINVDTTEDEDLEKSSEKSVNNNIPLKLLFHRQPGKVPVVFLPYFAEKNMVQIKPNKFLIADHHPVSYLYAIIRSRLKLKKNEAIFLMVGGMNLVLQSIPISSLYTTMKAANGVLYVTYCSQPTFG